MGCIFDQDGKLPPPPLLQSAELRLGNTRSTRIRFRRRITQHSDHARGTANPCYRCAAEQRTGSRPRVAGCRRPWVSGVPSARCDNSDQAVLVERTAGSAVVICRSVSGSYEYRGVRLRDGAAIKLPGATRIDGGFAAVNPTNATRYETRRDGLTITQNGQSRSESSVEYTTG
jgi:hypothetical protein